METGGIQIGHHVYRHAFSTPVEKMRNDVHYAAGSRGFLRLRR
jgi:hypothetical protein